MKKQISQKHAEAIIRFVKGAELLESSKGHSALKGISLATLLDLVAYTLNVESGADMLQYVGYHRYAVNVRGNESALHFIIHDNAPHYSCEWGSRN